MQQRYSAFLGGLRTYMQQSKSLKLKMALLTCCSFDIRVTLVQRAWHLHEHDERCGPARFQTEQIHEGDD